MKEQRLNVPQKPSDALFGEDAVNSEVVEASSKYNASGVAKECDDVLEDPDAGKEDGEEEGEGEDGGDE